MLFIQVLWEFPWLSRAKVQSGVTRLVDPQISALNTVLETKGITQITERAWNYVTLGYGHPEFWWRNFVSQLKQVGYDDVLSIEHEDFNLPPVVGVEKSVGLLRNVS